MRDKLKTIKRRNDDDEVKSSDSHGTFDGDDHTRKTSKKSALLDDPFLVAEEPVETVEEKKLRLAKEIIHEYASEKKNDFFDSLFAKT
jgi:hypothetical protein